jgi:hypothetical protein
MCITGENTFIATLVLSKRRALYFRGICTGEKPFQYRSEAFHFNSTSNHVLAAFPSAKHY